MAVERKMLPVEFPIDIEKGGAGLWYVTSPVVRGLFVVMPTKEAAISEVGNVLAKLAQAVDVAKAAFVAHARE